MCGEIHPFDLKSRQVPFSRAADQVETRDSLHSFSEDHVLEEQDPGKSFNPPYRKGLTLDFYRKKLLFKARHYVISNCGIINEIKEVSFPKYGTQHGREAQPIFPLWPFKHSN